MLFLTNLFKFCKILDIHNNNAINNESYDKIVPNIVQVHNRNTLALTSARFCARAVVSLLAKCIWLDEEIHYR